MDKYNIYLISKAEKDYRKLSPPVKERVKKAVFKLETTRFPGQFKPLIGKDIAQYRLRIGDYRILYDVYDNDKVVLIFRIGHRKEIYR